MAPRRAPGRSLVAALALCALIACKDKEGAKQTSELHRRCEQLAMTCGDKDKHSEKIVEQCTQAAKQHVDSGCAQKVFAVYDCYEAELCGKKDKVWALDDLRVLAERHEKCVKERDALSACGAKK